VFYYFLSETCAQGVFHLLVHLPQFRDVGLETCFITTCKLEKEELAFFLLCSNIRNMGCPKRPGQWPVFLV
jgi:hypothetical protein